MTALSEVTHFNRFAVNFTASSRWSGLGTRTKCEIKHQSLRIIYSYYMTRGCLTTPGRLIEVTPNRKEQIKACGLGSPKITRIVLAVYFHYSTHYDKVSQYGRRHTEQHGWQDSWKLVVTFEIRTVSTVSTHEYAMFNLGKWNYNFPIISSSSSSLSTACVTLKHVTSSLHSNQSLWCSLNVTAVKYQNLHFSLYIYPNIY